MRKYYLFLLLASLSVQFTFAQNNLATGKLDLYLRTLEQHDKFMGSVSIFKNGREIYNKSFGYADLKSQQRAGAETKYAIGSISKTYTAALIFKAIESGRLSLDQTIDKFFPSLKNATQITIEQLLQHRSGIRNFTNESSFPQWTTAVKTRPELLAIIEKGGVDFEPGTQMGYSNSNYVLLSFLLEDLYGKSYSEIINSQIINPLKLKNTGFGGADLCDSYTYNDGKWNLQTHTNSSITLGAGAVSASATDLNLFVKALWAGDVVSQESLMRMMHVKDNCGLGLRKMPFYELWGYGHGGHIDGFESLFIYFPDQNISCVILSNGVNMLLNDVTIAVLSDVFGKSYEVPDFTTIELKTEDLDKYLGVYSCPQIPIKLTISKNNKVLVGQGTGQIPFNLEASGKDKFSFQPGLIELIFQPEEKILILKQSGMTFTLRRE